MGPLFVALAHHNYSGFARLLDNGSDPNATSQVGFTILMDASYRGDDKAVQLLLRHKANVNRRDNDGGTALLNLAEVS